MNGNLYSNLLARSFDLFEEARQKSINLMNKGRQSEIRKCWAKVIDITKTATVVPSYKDFHLESAKKTAVIITGLSCTGKSTIAQVLAEEYPNFDVIQFDELGIRLMKENPSMYSYTPGLLDNHMVIRMGELLQDSAKKNHNLIIEGEYCALNARGALIKTLKILGYKRICIISTLSVPDDIKKTCAEKRSLIYAYTTGLKSQEMSSFMLRTFNEDVFAEIEGVADVQKIKRTQMFKQHVQDIESQRVDEFVKDMLPIQMHYNLLLAGADMYADWF